MRLKKGLLSNAQIRFLLRGGYLSERGKKKARAVLSGKYDKNRYVRNKQ